MTNNPFIYVLADAIGRDRVQTQETILDEATIDRWPLAQKWSAEETMARRPICVAKPRSSQETATIMQLALDHGITVVPRGGGSGVTGAAVPDAGSIVVDFTDMASVVRFEPDNLSVTVQSGILAGDLEAWLNVRGHSLGHFPQSLHLATMGGLVATRSTGTFSSKYGGIENLILGLEVVTPDAEIMRFRSLPRAAVGPQLLQLHVGAEGALGLVTEVTVKAFVQPEKRQFLAYAFPSVAAGLEAVRSGFRRHVVPAVLRLYDQVEAHHLYERVGRVDERPLLVVGHEGLGVLVEAEAMAFRDIACAHGGQPLGPEIGEAWEQNRYDASWLDDGNDGPLEMADAIEVAGNWTTLLPLFERGTEAIQAHASRVMSHFSHFYTTGGSIYFIVFIEGTDPESVRRRYQEAWDAVMRVTLAEGGTISHHHGVGLVRAPVIARDLGATFDVWRRIKDALDPSHALVPGKMGIQTREDGQRDVTKA